ncbi:DMT family transporter [Neptuniibacter sp. 1_MG-2023]|uniref:DMT family transporter n=1 Tax=Neptuniibacter sp. 1_MG-2023 TaxID=3062662 RepID=UPI0026E2CCE3|nr:DMT family transporter [Neptuniibacter sp. 1_MG-2023]MDO6593004.1 DMT family transporter [Neptuniibacter sp. 1_MG-2023]
MAYFLLVLTTLFWAGNFVLARAFSVDISPVTLAFIRWCCALLILLPFAVPAIYRHRGIILKHWPILVFLGALSVGSFNTLAYIGLQSTTALNGTLMQSTMPIMILLLSTIFLREAASMKQWLGVCLSLMGVLLLVCQGQLSILKTLNFNVGDLWIITAMFIWGGYSVALRWKPKEMSGFAFFSVTLVVGIICLAPFSWLETQNQPPIEWNQDLYLLIAYLAVFPSILSYLFWNYGVEKLSAQRAGLFIHLVPLWGMLLSVMFLGEQVQAFHLWGMTLIFSGIYFAVISSNSSSKKQQA